MTAEERIELALSYMNDVYDGDHHKMWVIDQMVRALTGDEYEARIKEFCDGDDGPETYWWETGTPP